MQDHDCGEFARVLFQSAMDVGMAPSALVKWIDALTAWLDQDFGTVPIQDVPIEALRDAIMESVERQEHSESTPIDDEFISCGLVISPLLQKMVVMLVDRVVTLESDRSKLYGRLDGLN